MRSVFDYTKSIHLLVSKLPSFRVWFLSDTLEQFLNFIQPHYCNFLLVIFESIFPLFGLHSLPSFLNVQMQIVFYSPVGFISNILIYWVEIQRSNAFNILFSGTFILTLTFFNKSYFINLSQKIFYFIYLFLSLGSFSPFGVLCLHFFFLGSFSCLYTIITSSTFNAIVITQAQSRCYKI